MTRPLIHIDDGEWYTTEWIGQHEECCKCGERHKVDYRVENGKLQFRATSLGKRRTK